MKSANWQLIHFHDNLAICSDPLSRLSLSLTHTYTQKRSTRKGQSVQYNSYSHAYACVDSQYEIPCPGRPALAAMVSRTDGGGTSFGRIVDDANVPVSEICSAHCSTHSSCNANQVLELFAIDMFK